MADSKTSKTFSVNLVAADQPIWSGEVSSAIVPAEAGEMGILSMHEPVLTVISKGNARVVAADGTERSFTVSDGFASFDGEKLIIAVENCNTPE